MMATHGPLQAQQLRKNASHITLHHSLHKTKMAQKRGVRIDAKSDENRPPPKLTKTITINVLAFALFTLVTSSGSPRGRAKLNRKSQTFIHIFEKFCLSLGGPPNIIL